VIDGAGTAGDETAGHEAAGDASETDMAEEIEAVRGLLAAADRIWQALGARVQMGPSEIVTLEALHFTSPLSTQQIRARTGLSAGAVTGLLDRFEARGLARRIRPEHNRRVVLTELTDAGRVLCDSVFGPLLMLVEQGAHDPELPGTAIRVQCLAYTTALLEHAATLIAPPPTGKEPPSPHAGSRQPGTNRRH
jgi:DNA-binding MarR family transcriptional regulator